MAYVCFKCNQPVAVTTRQLAFHLKGTHSISNHDQLVCFQGGCMQTFNFFNSYLRHVKRFHPLIQDDNLHADENNHRPLLNDDIGDDIHEEANEAYEGNAGNDEEQHYDVAEQTYLEELTEQQLQSQAAEFVIRMRGTASISTSAVTSVVNSTSMLFQDVVGSLKANVTALLQENNIDMQSPSVHELMTKFQSFSNPFAGLDTPFLQSKYMKENMRMVSPISLALGTRYDQYVDKLTGVMKQKLVTETFQYVPVLKTLEYVLTDSTLHLIASERSAGREKLGGFIDSEQFGQHPLFKEYSTALRLQLYYDDVEVTNPLGSKTTIHKLGLFYFSLDNLPRKYNSHLNTVHLLAVCHAIDLKKHGFDPILRPFVEEIKQLESDTGVELQLISGPRRFHGTLVSVVGDTLAMHDMFGLLSPSANKLCRICHATRDDIQTKFTEGEYVMRDIETHELHVHEAERMRNRIPMTGVKKGCMLNELRFFHTTTNYNFDIMHDLLEGVCPFEIKLLLNRCIFVENFFSLEELNSRMKSFAYQLIDRKNKPTELTRSVLTNLEDHKLRQHASQMWCLVRMLPFLIGDKVPIGHEHYELLLLLLRCMDIIFSPFVEKSQLLYLKHLIAEHHTNFKYLYPDFRLINKHHHMVHYPTCILMCGPLSGSSCFKYETKNSFSKTVGHINCNFRNICKSVAVKHQMHHALAYSQTISRAFECASGEIVQVQTLPAVGVITEYFGLNVNEVFIAKSVKLYGISYRPNLFVLVKLAALTREPCFSLIKHVIVVGQNEVYFVAQTCTTRDFVPHYHAFRIQCNHPANYHIVKPDDLVDHLPYSAVKSYSADDSFSYVSMRYVV